MNKERNKRLQEKDLLSEEAKSTLEKRLDEIEKENQSLKKELLDEIKNLKFSIL